MATSFHLLRRAKSGPTSMPVKKVVELMGRRVLVRCIYQREATTHAPNGDTLTESGVAKYWKVTSVPHRSGWIVGTTWLQNGRVVRGHPDEGGNEWCEDDRVQCLLVTYWPKRKPVKVPLFCFILQADDAEPFPHSDNYKWSERDRDALREEMLSVPRDKKGRFVSLYDVRGHHG